MKQFIADLEAFEAWKLLPVTERCPFLWPIDRAVLRAPEPEPAYEDSEVY